MLRLQCGEIFQIGKEAGEINRLIIKLDLTPFHLIHVDNIVEDIPERDGRNMDGFEIFFLLGGEFGIQQNAAQADDTIQRRTQFVTDGGDKRRFVAAGPFKRILIPLTLGNVATKAHQTVTFTHAVVVRHFTDFKAGFAPVRVIQPLFIGQ